MVLAAKRLNMKEASLRGGVNQNYCRDVIKRGRGKFELLERVASANGLSWQWLRTGEGEMYAPIVGRRRRDEPAPEQQANAIDQKVLGETMRRAFHLLGLAPADANALAKIVLSTAQARETPPSGDATKALRDVIAPYVKR
jgi:hypothetical protein